MMCTRSTSIIAVCLLIAACGGGSGTDSDTGAAPSDDGTGNDPTTEPTTGDDDTSPTDEAPAEADGGSGSMTDPLPEPQEDPAEDPPVDVVDNEAPTIVSVSPEAGAKGVLTNEKIIIEFSEPMDREATEAAYSSVDLPSEKVSFSWNNDSTYLTITPSSPLEYAIGFDPATLLAKTYAYKLGTGAQDASGNQLQAVFKLSFETARMFLAEAALVPSYSGSMNVETGDFEATLRSGDLDSDDLQRTYLTFSLPEIADEPLQMLVMLESAQIGLSGAPYTDLASGGQSLLVAPASFTTPEDIQALEMPAPIGNLSDLAALGPRSLDVTFHVEELYASDAVSAQFVVQFPTETDGDDSEDTVLLDHNSTRLAIAYLLP